MALAAAHFSLDLGASLIEFLGDGAYRDELSSGGWA